MISPNSPTDIQFCSRNSIAASEPLYGTAPRTDVWLLLEYPYPPGRKALPESNLFPEIKAHLDELQKNVPHSRLILIRNEHSQVDGEIHFYIADSNDQIPRLYETKLLDYNDLHSIDVPALLADKHNDRFSLNQEPLYTICTNGKRDACCARWGFSAYKSLVKMTHYNVWQSSHVGGHRFAANMICLPHGIYFGRTSPDNQHSGEGALNVADAYAKGNLAMEYYRGRGTYPQPAQAAEYFLRLKTKDYALNRYILQKSQEIQPNRWQVEFNSTKDGSTHELLIDMELSDEMIFESCSTPEERKILSYFELAGYSSRHL